MTVQEIRVANRIKNEILPKLQEMQRDLFMDKHISMNIERSTYKMCLNVTFFVANHEDRVIADNLICIKTFNFRTFLCREEYQMSENYKELRGCQYFIKNWQERLD